ncbi:sensor histidine kinase [Nitrospira sp.]|nr:sensor histidine kinase [Nitrospira sp.]
MTNLPATDLAAADLLQEAFRTFGEATTALESSYRALKGRVEQLDVELADRNEALRVTLEQTESMRGALDTILESLTTGVIVTDQDQCIERCNPAAASLLGVDTDSILGIPLEEFLLAHSLHVDGYPLATKTGALVSISRCTPRSDGTHTLGTVVLVQDITEVHRLEERLHRRDRLASMGEMVGRIAHEVRNPLGSVELFASMLRQDLAHDAVLHGYAEHISMAVKAMDRLLSNLLTYTRPSNPQRAWNATAGLVRDSLALAAHALAGRKVDVQVNLDHAPPNMWCDGQQIRQVLVNLILNAVDAMEEEGRLTVTVEDQLRSAHESPVARLSVADTGRGIDPEHLSRVFDPFFTTRDEGTGLGLAIVHALVEGHDGRVEIESQVGTGTTVTVAIPQETNPLRVRARAKGPAWFRGPMKEEV